MPQKPQQQKLEATRKIIPWGTQTNAKRPIEEFADAMPFFIERAQGCRIWDPDGCEFIDFRSALGPISLGYCYPEVDAAVKAQMQKGVLFSMASPIELELALKMTAMVPGLEAVRFLKTGGDACSAALRLARTYTRKYNFISVGYHGWHDAFIAARRDPGIPAGLQNYIHDVPFGDLDQIKHWLEVDGENIGAMIVEPFTWNRPPDFDYLRGLRQLCDATGTVLIFDEVLTGFRLARGGAIEYFGIQPDLAVYAKALANGYPLSAFGGKKLLMHTLEQTFISATHAGDTISIAAALATLTVMQREPVHAHLHEVGALLFEGINALMQHYALPLQVDGVPTGFSFVTGQEPTTADLAFIKKFEREIFAANIFCYKTWYVNYSHTRQDIELTLTRLESAIKKALAG